MTPQHSPTPVFRLPSTLALLVALLLSAQCPVEAQSATCSNNDLKLTSECGEQCSSGVCVVPAASEACVDCLADNETSSCFCVEETVSASHGHPVYVLDFVIPFGEFKSDREEEARAADSDYDVKVAELADISTTPSASNDVLQTIDALDLSSRVTNLRLSGGSGLYLRSKVVHVEFASELLSEDSWFNVVSINSIDLRDVTGHLSTMLPTGLTSLSLENDLLTEVPSGLPRFSSLEGLSLAANYIEDVDSSVLFPDVESLNLDSNGMRTFDAAVPTVTYLSLSDNNLTECPSVLAESTGMTSLSLDNNSISSCDLTLPSLSILRMRNNDLSEIPAIVFNNNSLDTVYLKGSASKFSRKYTPDQVTAFEKLYSIDLTDDDFVSMEETDCATELLTSINDIRLCVAESAANISSSTGNGSVEDSPSGDEAASSTDELTVAAEGESSAGITTQGVVGVVSVLGSVGFALLLVVHL